MRFSNVDNWGLAATSVFSLVIVLLLQHGRALDISTQAQAASANSERPAPTFFMTITAKRLPMTCKGALADGNAAYCSAFFAAEPAVTMSETGPRYADLDQLMKAETAPFPETIAAQR